MEEGEGEELEGARFSLVAPAGCILPSSADAIIRPDALSVTCPAGTKGGKGGERRKRKEGGR